MVAFHVSNKRRYIQRSALHIASRFCPRLCIHMFHKTPVLLYRVKEQIMSRKLHNFVTRWVTDNTLGAHKPFLCKSLDSQVNPKLITCEIIWGVESCTDFFQCKIRFFSYPWSAKFLEFLFFGSISLFRNRIFFWDLWKNCNWTNKML